MITLEFYIYGILIYIPTALVFSYAYHVYTEYKALMAFYEKPTVTKVKKTPKPQKIQKFIPEGKVGVCTCCDTYLIDDSFYYSHIDGKKHKQNVSGVLNWLRFIPFEEYTKNKDARKVSKVKVQTHAEDYDEGYVL
jgi:hypothetical protein